MEEIIEKIRELVSKVAPTLNTGEGSPFDQVVLSYIRDQFGVGDLDLDIEDMIIKRINQLDPDIVTSPGSAVHEFLIKELSAIFAVPRLEIQRIKNNQDLNNIDTMTEAEVDRRMSMFFRTRRYGDVSIGVVRAYFASPTPVTINLTNRAITSGGLAFLPDGIFTFKRSLVSSNKEKGLYYVDIRYVAEQPGDQYNIGPGEITTIENLPGLVRATNLNRFVGGVPTETNEEFVNRTLKSLSERSLGSKTSIISVITDQFPNQALAVSPIGFGDEEMERDAFVVNPSVTVDSIKLLVTPISGATTVDLPHTDIDYTSSFEVYVDNTPQTIGTGGDAVVSIGTGASGVDQLVFNSPTTGLLIVKYVLLDGYVNLVKDLPGSIETPPLFPVPHQYQVVHLGGKVDVYVKPSLLDTDELLVLNLGRHVIYKTDDGVIYQDTDGFWYFETGSKERTDKIGAIPGDVVQVVQSDPYGNVIDEEGYASEIYAVDESNDRYRLSGPPSEFSKNGWTYRSDLDVKIFLKEERAIPLNRLVALDVDGDPIFLPSNIDPLSSSDSDRQTSLDPEVNAPVLPSFGYILRDSSLDKYSDPIQRNLPTVAKSTSTLLASNGGLLGSDVDYTEGEESNIGKILYFAATENIASGNIKAPFLRIKSVNLLNPLSFQKRDDQKIPFRLPVDVRSKNLSGGVNKDSDFSGIGREASGLVKIYFTEPTTVLLYGPGVDDIWGGSTRFTRRVDREIRPGTFVTFNLVYRLATTAESGGPSLLVLPEDFQEENGLYFFEVPVVGETQLSTRSDGLSVDESDLNLEDGEELYIGYIPISDELSHKAEELEYGPSGEPIVLTGGDSINGKETPSSGSHPYVSYTGSFSSDVFSTSPSLNFVENEIPVGSKIRILEVSPTSFYSDPSASFDGTSTIAISNSPSGDLAQDGVETGDYVILDSGSAEGIVTGISGVTITVQVVSGSLAAGSYSAEIYKWSARSNHTILSIIDETSVRVSDPITGTGLRFVVVSDSGITSLRNPQVRVSSNSIIEGTPGNEPNGGIRTEGYLLDCRNPFDRSLSDRLFTYSVEEFSLFRYTAGTDTRYEPSTGLDGELTVDLHPQGYLSGKGRENFDLLNGSRVPVTGIDYALLVSSPRIQKKVILDTDTPDSTATGAVAYDLPSNSVYEELTRAVHSSGTELVQVGYSLSGITSLGLFEYAIEIRPGNQDRVWFNSSLIQPGESVDVIFKERLESVVLSDVSPTSISFSDGVLSVDVDLSSDPKTAEELAALIKDNTDLYAVVSSSDRGGSVQAGTYAYPSTRPFLTSKNFATRKLDGKDISIEYEWSSILSEVHEFVTSQSIRSTDQDVLVRAGIPVFINVDMTLVSSTTTPSEAEKEVRDYILKLDQQPVDLSSLVRLPKVATSVPLPVYVSGLRMNEDRVPSVLRSDSQITPRRVEAAYPDQINVELGG